MSSTTATKAELARLTISGGYPGLLRKGSPVIYVDGSPGLMTGGEKGGCLVVRFRPGERHGLVSDPEFEGGDTGWPSMGDVELDLTDATGRAHATWWLAGHPALWSVDARHMHCWKTISQDAPDRLLNRYWLHPVGDDKINCAKWPTTWVKVPALANLNPDDPRLCPDGSRWVDAEALRLVCHHVANPEVPRV